MNRLFVWMRFPDATLRLVGELATTDPTPYNGHFRSEFEYALDWTVDSGAFALDPESLPLNTSSRRFDADLFYPPLSIFDDSLPDDWGRALLATLLRSEGRKPASIIEQVVTAAANFANEARKLRVRGTKSLARIAEDVHRRAAQVAT